MPKVSVLVPIYNVQRYLKQCLESIISQTLKEIEIICVDDGSTDGSGDILDQYAEMDERIIALHKNNSGYGHSMNVALAHATGEYVAIVESDDFVETDMLEKLYITAVERKADVVKANHYTNRNGKDIFSNRLSNYPLNKILNVSTCPEIVNIADTIWTCLYKRGFLEKNKIYFHETPGASFQDISFSLQVWINAQRVYFVQDAVLHYRNDNPDSSMHNPDKIFCVFDEYEWAEKQIKRRWKDMPEMEKYFVASKYRDYFNHYHRVASQYQYALLLKIKESLEGDLENGKIHEDAFLSGIWAKLCMVHKDMNDFFQQTAKDKSDMRIASCEFMNEDAYAYGFLKKMKEDFSQVVIYGAGAVGKRLAEAMVQKGCKIDSFAVTEVTGNDRECMGIPVRRLEELDDWKDSCAVIIAVAERSKCELYQNLVKHNFKNIFQVDKIISKI